MCWLFQFLQKLQLDTIPCSVLNCQNFLRLYFPMFQFRFLVRKNMVQTTSCFKPHYCLQWAQWRHNMAVVLPNMDIEPSKMANFKLAVNGYVFLYSSITISKLAKRAVFSHSRDVERHLKNKLFLERSSPLTALPSLNDILLTKMWRVFYKTHSAFFTLLKRKDANKNST